MSVTIIDRCIERDDGSVLCYDTIAQKYYVTITKEVAEDDITKEEFARLMKTQKKVIKHS